MLLIVISLFNPTAKERVFDKTFAQMNLLDKNKRDKEGLYIFTKAHTHHYITAYKMFLDNKVFGVGVKNFRNFCSDSKYEISKLSCSSHPHNTYIQILTETGVVGFIFLLSTLFFLLQKLFLHFFYKFNKKIFFSDFEICILSGISIYLWPFIPTGNVFSNWLNILLILNLPLLVYSKKLVKTW